MHGDGRRGVMHGSATSRTPCCCTRGMHSLRDWAALLVWTINETGHAAADVQMLCTVLHEHHMVGPGVRVQHCETFGHHPLQACWPS
jgi:hypothetical protein